MEWLIFIFLLILVIYSLTRHQKYETFDPINYSRAYPGTFSYRYGYGPYYYKFYDPVPIGTGSFIPKYGDYWYIPAHQYLNRWINGPAGIEIPNSCLVPPVTNEYCVDRRLRNNENIYDAISDCTSNYQISDACPLLTDRYQ